MANNANSKNKAQNGMNNSETNSAASKNKTGNAVSQNGKNCKNSENCFDKNSYTSESEY